MLASLTVIIIVQLYPNSPPVFWVEAGESCASFYLWRRRAEAWRVRNGFDAASGPHGSCTIAYRDDFADVLQRAARAPSLAGFLYLQVPEFTRPR